MHIAKNDDAGRRMRDKRSRSYRAIRMSWHPRFASEPRIEVFRRSDGWVGEVGAHGMAVLIHGGSVDVDAIHALASAAPPTIVASPALAPELEATATI